MLFASVVVSRGQRDESGHPLLRKSTEAILFFDNDNVQDTELESQLQFFLSALSQAKVVAGSHFQTPELNLWKIDIPSAVH